MGLALTLTKKQTHMATDFVDAYWYLSDLGYSKTEVGFTLSAFPSREAKNKNLTAVEEPSIGYGSCINEFVNCELYRWQGMFPIETIFPNGIPLDEDEQSKTVYNFIKDYTQLPWKDVIEN